MIYGAALFQKVKLCVDHGEKYVLRWIWIHLSHRNRGKLPGLWKDLEEKFGDFYIDRPVSEDMKKFLKKREDDEYEHHQLKVP